MYKFYCLALLLSLSGGLSAQSNAAQAPKHRPGELIVQTQPGAPIDAIVARLNRLPVSLGTVVLDRVIVPEWRYYLLKFDETRIDPRVMLETCYQIGDLSVAQLNHELEYRNVEPNDPDWYLQSDMTLIRAPEAWQASTGGLTPNGDTIVIAVLEKGILFDHPDLKPNRWWNWHDKKGDNQDNDGNGYVDDFGGWDASENNDGTGDNGDHGTEVAGIIGARGNNNLGIAGVNWNVKLLNISGVLYDDDILEAYRYVYNTRKLYNDTNGAKGAFIVASNASFGYDFQWYYSTPNFTNWCSLFDSLGTIGVLNIGATSNKEIDVDEKGDMPTSCPSEFLVSVTNIDKLGYKVKLAGYGQQSVDLGAPGQGTYSTTNVGGNTPGYGIINGTSGATPHVTGTVGLLYSLGCEAFTSDALTNPIACTRRVRDVILNNTEPNSTLEGITSTGGHLDIKKAVDGVTELCAGSVGPLEILQFRYYESSGEVRLYYQTPTFLPYSFRVFNMLGQQLYAETLTPDQFSENYVKFDTRDLPRGVYVFSIGRGEAIVSVKFPKI